MSEISIASVPLWFKENIAVYESLSDVVSTTITTLIKAKRLPFLAVSGRAKTLESLIEKVDRKGYQNISNITDIVGVRIIVYIEADVNRACELVEQAFKIHRDKSVDKSAELGSNEIGYRSVHYVCELGTSRTVLPELVQYTGMLFEVQIRTVLQHAWAEIEHDRSYKFSGELPAAIKRRLNLLAGNLEMIDREFDLLALEVDKHEREVKKAAKSGILTGVELTSAGLTEFLLSVPEVASLVNFPGLNGDWPEATFKELRQFGVKNLSEFSALITNDFVENFVKTQGNRWTTGLGFVRSAMLYKNIDHYFETATDRTWTGVGPNLAELLDARYGVEKVNEIFQSFNLARMENAGTRTAPRKVAAKGRRVSNSKST